MEEAPTAAAAPALDPSSLAGYLAKVRVARDGYTEGAAPEAVALLSACDAVLTRSDGVSFLVTCVVDAERDPERRFGLDREALRAIGKACQQRYCAPIYGGTRTAVGFEIVEVRRGPTEADRARLAALRGASRQCVVSAYLVDPEARRVEGRSGALGDVGRRRRALERRVLEPRLAPGELVAAPEAVLPAERGKPIATVAMLALFTVLYVLEVLTSAHASEFSPDIDALVAWGGVSRTLLERGEWHRLLTAALLHASPLHLLFNGIAFWIGGAFLEGLVGSAWLLVIFTLGALGGSLMSAALNAPNVVSVGASGAIMGMLASGFLVTFRVPRRAGRARLQSGLLRMLIPSLLPLATVKAGESIDYADHFGGTLAGVLAGGFLLLLWPRDEARPRLAGLTRALALGAIALALWGGFRVQALFPRYAVAAQLIPPGELPRDDAAAEAQADALVAKYPRDPRSHLFRGLALLQKDKAPEAEVELRAALADPTVLATHFDVALEVVIRSLLAQSLLAQDKDGAAKEAVQPVCHAGEGGRVPKELKALKLCGE